MSESHKGLLPYDIPEISTRPPQEKRPFKQQHGFWSRFFGTYAADNERSAKWLSIKELEEKIGRDISSIKTAAGTWGIHHQSNMTREYIRFWVNKPLKLHTCPECGEEYRRLGHFCNKCGAYVPISFEWGHDL